VLHYDPIQVGLASCRVALGIAGMSLGFSAALIERFGARTTLLPSLVLVAAGSPALPPGPVHASYFADILPAVLPLGIGAGLAFPSIIALAMSTATPEDSGLVSGWSNTTQQVAEPWACPSWPRSRPRTRAPCVRAESRWPLR